MKGLAELVVSLCDLCEAEGRLLEAGILRTVRRVAFLSLGLLFGAAALALLLAALYALLTVFLPTPAALALLGTASAGVAACLLLGARGAPPAGAQAGAASPSERGSAAVGVAEIGATPAPVPPAGAARDVWAGVAPYGRSARPVRQGGRPACRTW